jgi:hypothetical protein
MVYRLGLCGDPMKRRSLIAGGASATAFAALKPAKAQTTAYAVVPTLDDPQNTSGLGTAAILRGTVSTYSLAGQTPGAGQTTAVRQANATALQNAINYCAANGKMLEVVPNTYEINSSTGLLIPACAGFVWRGEMFNSNIVQFFNGGTGAPVITLGDTVGINLSSGWEFHGIGATYGASQTGLTAAQAIIVGNLVLSKVGSIGILNSTFPPYNGFAWTAPLGNFSNIYDNINIQPVQNHFMTESTGGGTGNILDNIYLNNGGIGTAIRSPAVT